jgi:hypothetical protein
MRSVFQYPYHFSNCLTSAAHTPIVVDIEMLLWYVHNSSIDAILTFTPAL